VTACAEISGSVELGEYAWVGPNASIIQKQKIGAQAFVGIGATLMRSADPGETVAGYPAKGLPGKSVEKR
jgi:UDP-3-O-[3-hydroxymyristoyl] glucosamine N-acyltransferase